ncbi:transmembrane 7 superfamily member 3 isoform X2 [Anabrus simplex]|uniref:transmembrane 7 superfamily member 3 isoform X2 n=1 Tax=Anabrus simplex TaxID=316456 RepID=UPI0035A2D51F
MAFNKMSWLGMFPTILLISIFMNGNAVSVKDGDTVNISLLNYSVSSSMMVEQYISVAPLTTVTLNILNIPRVASFVLAHTHSYDHSTTLSYSEILNPHGYINGTDIGLVKMNGPIPMQFFIYNGNPDAAYMLVIIQAYGKYAPLPGGCNMEFSVETAPYLQLRLSRSLITVDAQLASLPSLSLACDDYSSLIHLEIYHMYLPERDFTPESYYDAIRKMSTVDSIRSNGKLVAAPERGSTLRRTFSAYPGTGSVYGVIAVSGYSASAYVPAFTYACGSKYIPDEDMCEILTLDVFSFFSGLGFGLLWLGFWLCFGIPILTVLLATLTLGYILASVAMFAGLGDYALLQWDINYWTAFICIMISICVIFSPLMHKANILCCAILGAFAIVAPIDHYIGSNLKFIVVNTMRRATVPEFSSAIIDPPFQWKDCLLSVSWILMSIIGVGAQCWLQRGKPPFPPPPYQPRDESFTTTRRRGLSLVRGEDATERTPLVTDARILYGASSDSVFSSPATHNDVGTSGSRIGRLLTVLKIYHRDPVDSNK